MTPDPYKASGGPSGPEGWNRYAFVAGDPVNFGDPGGLDLTAEQCIEDVQACDGSTGSSGFGSSAPGSVSNPDWGCEYGSAFYALPNPACYIGPGILLQPQPRRPIITLKELDDCIYPNGIGTTAVTGSFTLFVEYQVLVNGMPVYGNNALNGYGISISESVVTTSGSRIDGGGQWCPSGGQCNTAPSMGTDGTFWDKLAGGPSTANQTFLANGQPVVVYFPGASSGATVLKNTYNSPGNSITVGNGALKGTSKTRLCGRDGDPGQ